MNDNVTREYNYRYCIIHYCESRNAEIHSAPMEYKNNTGIDVFAFSGLFVLIDCAQGRANSLTAYLQEMRYAYNGLSSMEFKTAITYTGVPLNVRWSLAIVRLKMKEENVSNKNSLWNVLSVESNFKDDGLLEVDI